MLFFLLQEVAHIAVEIGATLDSDGMELIFLNRSGATGVTKWEQAQKVCVVC